jgi:hypothetical protein
MKSNFELCRDGFHAINEFKRSRTLEELARQEGNTDSAMYHELKMFKAFDRIELTLRAIQQNERNLCGNLFTRRKRITSSGDIIRRLL